MRRATVVLPVPGLPVKLMWSDGAPADRPAWPRSFSMSSREAISRIRVFTGASPTSSASRVAKSCSKPDSVMAASSASEPPSGPPVTVIRTARLQAGRPRRT